MAFKKSSFSGGGNDCVEVDLFNGWGDIAIAVRDSESPVAVELYFSCSQWQAFIKGVKAGEFDVTTS